MQLEHSFDVPGLVEDAWSVLLDVERIAPIRTAGEPVLKRMAGPADGGSGGWRAGPAVAHSLAVAPPRRRLIDGPLGSPLAWGNSGPGPECSPSEGADVVDHVVDDIYPVLDDYPVLDNVLNDDERERNVRPTLGRRGLAIPQSVDNEPDRKPRRDGGRRHGRNHGPVRRQLRQPVAEPAQQLAR